MAIQKKMLQQYLPFTVLKPDKYLTSKSLIAVATVPTVYGIETYVVDGVTMSLYGLLQQYLPFTVLKLFSRFISFRKF